MVKTEMAPCDSPHQISTCAAELDLTRLEAINRCVRCFTACFLLALPGDRVDAGGAAELGDEEGSLASLGGGGHDVGGAQEHPTVVHRHARPAMPYNNVNVEY